MAARPAPSRLSASFKHAKSPIRVFLSNTQSRPFAPSFPIPIRVVLSNAQAPQPLQHAADNMEDDDADGAGGQLTPEAMALLRESFLSELEAQALQSASSNADGAGARPQGAVTDPEQVKLLQLCLHRGAVRTAALAWRQQPTHFRCGQEAVPPLSPSSHTQGPRGG